MKVVTSIAKMQELSRQVRAADLTVGFVPTMGYLHEGHLDLVRRARAMADVVVVSIFVNPTQFDRKDDFDAYPRDDDRDRRLLEAERVDMLFMPAADEVYGDGAATKVSVSGITTTLCGAHRPGHFDGVATVVTALFNMVGPDFAVFGEKDYQQLQMIRRMVHDLHIPVRIVAAPTVRESDGLAMSSRNTRLTPEQRAAAPAIQSGLRAAAAAYLGGERGADALRAMARSVIEGAGIEIEYLEAVDGETLQPVNRVDDGSVIAIAAWMGGRGGVRLIDNVVLARVVAEARAAEQLDRLDEAELAEM